MSKRNTKKNSVKPTRTKPKVAEKAPESLYAATIIFLILFLWQVAKFLINPSGINPLIAIGLLIGLIIFGRKLLQYGIKIEKVSSWKKVYYSIPMYILLALTIPLLAAAASSPVAGALRTSRGLPPVSLDGFETIGIAILSMIFLGINAVYSFIALVVGVSRDNQKLKRILFNVGIIMIVLSCLLVNVAYINLVVGAPAEGYPKWNF